MIKYREFYIFLMLLALPIFSVTDLSTGNVQAQSDDDQTLARLKELSDFNNWPGKTELNRDGINFSKYVIPSLSKYIKDKRYETPFSLHNDQEDVFVEHHSRWQKTSVDFIEINIIFANSCQKAHEYLIRSFFNSEMPFEARVPKKDQPIIAGDISFDRGCFFIRNNMVIELQALGALCKENPIVAFELDSLLLLNPTIQSVDQFKPVIKQFSCEKNTVKKDTYTGFIIDTVDPKGSELYYSWELSGGGISNDKQGKYRYYAGGPEGSVQKVTLIVINDRGYYATADCEIKIE
jgi:hypothetical protein